MSQPRPVNDRCHDQADDDQQDTRGFYKQRGEYTAKQANEDQLKELANGL